MIPDKKVCGDCNIEKDKSEFPLRNKDGYVSLRLQCYVCMRKRKRIRYSNNREKIIEINKLYTERNKEMVYARQNEWKAKNIDHVIAKRKERYLEKGDVIRSRRSEYYYKNREKCIDSVNNYQKQNISKVRENQRIRHGIRKKDDLSYRMVRLLRGRVIMAIKKKGKKCARTKELIGCTIPFLIKYIEDKFTDGMTWDNQGIHGWHIDHRKPCSKFDLTLPEEQKRCFHYSNMQPLWAIDNLKKSDKWEETEM